MNDDPTSRLCERRRFLGAAAAGLAALAGCSASNLGPQSDRSGDGGGDESDAESVGGSAGEQIGSGRSPFGDRQIPAASRWRRCRTSREN
jgi:iron(III) transport system substrate-binding protein